MIATPLAAFGYVVFLVDMQANETRDVTLNEQGLARSGYYFYVKGRMTLSVIETGEVLEDRIPGWLNAEHTSASASSSGTVHTVYLEDSQWLCIPNDKNPKGLPNLTSVVLSDNETIELPLNTDLYLTRGTLVIGDRTFVGPRQIRVRSGDVIAQSSGDSYSLKFE